MFNRYSISLWLTWVLMQVLVLASLLRACVLAVKVAHALHMHPRRSNCSRSRFRGSRGHTGVRCLHHYADVDSLSPCARLVACKQPVLAVCRVCCLGFGVQRQAGRPCNQRFFQSLVVDTVLVPKIHPIAILRRSATPRHRQQQSSDDGHPPANTAEPLPCADTIDRWLQQSIIAYHEGKPTEPHKGGYPGLDGNRDHAF